MFAQIFYAVAPSQDEKFPKTSPCPPPVCAHLPLVAPPASASHLEDHRARDKEGETICESCRSEVKNHCGEFMIQLLSKESVQLG